MSVLYQYASLASCLHSTRLGAGRSGMADSASTSLQVQGIRISRARSREPPSFLHPANLISLFCLPWQHMVFCCVKVTIVAAVGC